MSLNMCFDWLKKLRLFSHDPDLVQAFLKKWWVESDFKAPKLPLSLTESISNLATITYSIFCVACD